MCNLLSVPRRICCLHVSLHVRKGFCDNAGSSVIQFVIYMTLCVCFADIDDCVGVTCSGHGTCVDGVNSHSCNCNAGFTGYMCETSMSFYSVASHSIKLICTSVKHGHCTWYELIILAIHQVFVLRNNKWNIQKKLKIAKNVYNERLFLIIIATSWC